VPKEKIKNYKKLKNWQPKWHLTGVVEELNIEQ
jgi:hypothetical protein